MNDKHETNPDKPHYKGWFWCSDRKDYFRWNDLMAYYKSQKQKDSL
jgi:hypothetical protein